MSSFVAPGQSHPYYFHSCVLNCPRLNLTATYYAFDPPNTNYDSLPKQRRTFTSLPDPVVVKAPTISTKNLSTRRSSEEVMTDQLESKMIDLCVAYRDVGEGREQEQTLCEPSQ